MSTEQTTAIVLRTVEFSETSLIVTLLTKDLGQVSAIAKGARRPKGPFEGSLDLLAVCRVVIIRKNNDSLDILTEAKLHRRFRGADRSLERLYGGYYVAEMLRLLLDDHADHPDVYDLTIKVLQQLDGTGPVASSLAFFDLQILRMLGHAPSTESCIDCGTSLSLEARIPFAIEGGGIVCRSCRSRQRSIVMVRAETMRLINVIQNPNLDAPIPISNNHYGELRSVLNRYIQNVLGRLPRMQAFLPMIAKNEFIA
ncbi:MAG: DNA repair protein RecO [Rubripirellula sp.]|nr:DNA repair protein RecO [Rubripirellula sp.]MDA9776876.1 DNA repair protein RecO [Rubripirellula sp.]